MTAALTARLQTWDGFLTYPEAQGVLMDFVSVTTSHRDRRPGSHSQRCVLQHEYQIFNYNQINMSQDQHINVSRPSVRSQLSLRLTKPAEHPCVTALQYSCQVLDTLSSYAKSNLYTVSGEWSNAITDCAKWLNGRGVGARWDGTWQPNQPTFGSCDGYTGNMSTFSDDYKKFLRKCVFSTGLVMNSEPGTNKKAVS